MERMIRYGFAAVVILCIAWACEQGVDKDPREPEPAVGRTFEGDDPQNAESDSTNTEASHPIRDVRSDSAQ
jgi:hypothetical protein